MREQEIKLIIYTSIDKTIRCLIASNYNNVGKLCSISTKTESVTVDAIQMNKHVIEFYLILLT